MNEKLNPTNDQLFKSKSLKRLSFEINTGEFNYPPFERIILRPVSKDTLRRSPSVDELFDAFTCSN